MIQAVLFDFNGVIIDDEPLQMKAYQEALGAEGIELTEEDYYGSLGTDDVTFVRAAYERAGRELDDVRLEGLERLMGSYPEGHDMRERLEALHVDLALEGVNEDIRILTDAIQHPRGT